ncbi:MAG: dihydrolipoyl dehydrogenase [Planctomycetota bacterium]|nr:dihydrolipoyl dehydrogenase [Planctomycetota bacterium]
MTYDILVLGSGPGGYAAAIKASIMGAKSAVVESEELGGTCLNWGCIPTKALAQSAHLIHCMESAGKLGIEASEFKADWEKVQEHAENVVANQRKGLASLLKAHKVDVIEGHGRLVEGPAIEVDSDGDVRRVEAQNVIVATGSRPITIPGMDYDGEKVINSDHAIYFDKLPGSMVVVGGGVIGCELATILASFGVKITIVEMMDRILPPVDAEIVKNFSRKLKRMKIKVHTGTKVTEADTSGEGVSCSLDNGETFEADKCLVVVGREPVIDDNNLLELDLCPDERSVDVDERCRTNMDKVWAIGDVTGKWMLAHSATKMAKVAVADALGEEASLEDVVIPNGIFTIPEIGYVGLTEEEAREEYGEVKVGKYLYRPLGRAQAGGQLDGLFKVIAKADDHRIVGVHIFGHEATDLVAEGTLAIQKGLTLEDVHRTVHTHPTFTEGLYEACGAALGEGIHSLPEK